MNSFTSKSNIDAGEILLIGDSTGVLSGADTSAQLPVQTCTGMLEGIEEAVKKKHFKVITVVMSKTATNLHNGLATLRKNTDAKILLLARMYEEPKAIKLVASAYNGTGLADDYIIYPVTIEKLCAAIYGISGKTADTVTIAADKTTRTRIEQLEKLATEDDLTGMKNRRYIWEFARQIIKRAKKDNGRITLLIFDIDNFKHYNDVYGHTAGDEVLKQTALLIRRCCRKHDVVARLGGDEFAVVFWDDPLCTPPPAGSERRSFTGNHPGEVVVIAKRFRRELEKAEFHLLGPEGKGVLTISGGLTSSGPDSATIEELFEKADSALLEAKRSGKNRIYLVGQPENDIDKIE